MSKRNKLVVPEAQQAVNNLKMEIAQDMGISAVSGATSEMYPAVVNGLSVREMVRMGEKMLMSKQNQAPTDNDIF
jgi:hypothetical protein